MSAPAISALEQNIRQKAGDEAARQLAEHWQKAFYYHSSARVTPDEGKVINDVKERMISIARAKAGDQAVITFLTTYRNLVYQFPDLVETGEEDACA